MKDSWPIALNQLEELLDFRRNLLVIIGLLLLFLPLVLIAVTNPEPLFRLPYYWSVVKVLGFAAWSFFIGGFFTGNNRPDVREFSYEDAQGNTVVVKYRGNSQVLAVVLVLLGIVVGLLSGLNIFFLAVLTMLQVIGFLLPGFHANGRFIGSYLVIGDLMVLAAFISFAGMGV